MTVRAPWLIGGLLAALALLFAAGLMLGETALTSAQAAEAFSRPGSGPFVVLWEVRAPRTVVAMLTGAALGLAGAVMQGLLRNPLAEPGVLGVSATAALGAALAIVSGAAALPGAVEVSALIGAGLAGAVLSLVAWRTRAPEALILFGVALASFAGAATSLIFNLSPSPIATAEVMSWLMGSAENRSWTDAVWVGVALIVAGALAISASRGLRQLTLGEEAAEASGIDMGRTRAIALVAATVAAGAAVAATGVIGFVGLAAPHLVRTAVRGDPGRLILPSALAGAVLLGLADIAARMIPTDQELKMGVLTALVGAPLFALIAWRAAKEWRL